MIFWAVFFIGVLFAFAANRETINKNFNLLVNRLSSSPSEGRPIEDRHIDLDNTDIDVQQPVVVVPPAVPSTPPPEPMPPVQPAPSPVSPAPPPVQPASPPPVTQARPAETRDRNVYFMQIDRDGQILRQRVTRRVALSDSPMLDVLNVLLTGPTAEERNRGIVSFIPPGTRILSALIRGTTAYINFSDEMQFNTFGAEGYAAQVRQIVWTATEFPTVNDVQILIEGRPVDFLGEGIWIGSPLNRNSM